MCGIAGLIHKGATSDIGSELTAMLQALKHRGPDSTGFALYGPPDQGRHVMRFKVAEQEETRSGFEIHRQMRERKALVDERLAELGAEILEEEPATEYAFRYLFKHGGELRRLADFLEDIEGVEILSLGHGLELIKDLGDATQVCGDYGLNGFAGSHGLGHTRMATESDVDIRSAHPYWAYPFNDVAVVHNGQLTNYWGFRRALERRGHRFMSNCDSELIAVYVADQIERGNDLEGAMRRSIDELDGVFTYLVATSDSLGMAKDVHMGYEEGKPAVFDRNINGWVQVPEDVALPDNQQDRDMIARELLLKFQMSERHPMVDLKKAYAKF